MNPPLGPPPIPLEPAGLFQALAAHPERIADLIDDLHRRAVDAVSLLDLLGRIARQAVYLLRGVDCVAITAQFDTIPVTMASTAHRALILDSYQHTDNGGPARRALVTGCIITINRTRMAQVSPALAHTAALVGIGTITSLPLHMAERPVATLNLYSADEQLPALDADVLTVLTFYAQRGLTDFLLREHPADAGRSMRAALAERSVVAQATGLLMQIYGFSADYAGQVLLDQAQDWHRTLSEQANHILANHHQRLKPSGDDN